MKYMLDIAIGMHYISEKGLIHRVREPGIIIYNSCMGAWEHKQ